MSRKDASPGQKESAAERRQQSMHLRKMGKSYRAIGKELGISEAQAHRDVVFVIKSITALTQDSAREHQALELERLEMAMSAIASSVEKGHLQAIDRWVRLCESRRKLLGIDAPAKQEINSAIAFNNDNYQTMDAAELSRLYTATIRDPGTN
ncbi:hypothetical protein [Chroococcidiopsis sp.]|uniref:hypothetical protein n=1 Tax=Chroococcidiopsis sp. TaxID=3088168 RepID=UPI003F3F3B91